MFEDQESDVNDHLTRREQQNLKVDAYQELLARFQARTRERLVQPNTLYIDGSFLMSKRGNGVTEVVYHLNKVEQVLFKS